MFSSKIKQFIKFVFAQNPKKQITFKLNDYKKKKS